jgi:hypothetical protein
MAMTTSKLGAENADEEIKGLEAVAFQLEHLLAAKLSTLQHFYSRLQRIGDGNVLAFDLYHRMDGIGQGSPVRAMLTYGT